MFHRDVSHGKQNPGVEGSPVDLLADNITSPPLIPGCWSLGGREPRRPAPTHPIESVVGSASPVQALRTHRGIARELHGQQLKSIVVTERELPLTRAIGTYLFNSQFITGSDSHASAIICPTQVDEDDAAKAVLMRWSEQDLFDAYHFADLRQSMSGGGGPACLRLRVPMTEQELSVASPQNHWCERRDEELRRVIERDYPDHVTLTDLANPDFVRHAQHAYERVKEVF